MAANRAGQKGQEVNTPRRGDIFLVSLDPTVGSEIKKTRPALVIQNDIANRYSPVTIVAAMTTNFGNPPYPTEVVMEPKESGLDLHSAALLNQIRSVHRQRLIRRFGHANAGTMRRVDRAIQINLGLVGL
jgi:mRNA interferase MazF